MNGNLTLKFIKSINNNGHCGDPQVGLAGGDPARRPPVPVQSAQLLQVQPSS